MQPASKKKSRAKISSSACRLSRVSSVHSVSVFDLQSDMDVQLIFMRRQLEAIEHLRQRLSLHLRFSLFGSTGLE